MTWNKLMVFRLVDKNTVHVSRIVQREDGKENAENCRSGHFQSGINQLGGREWVWHGSGNKKSPTWTPTPTILSTLFALIVEAMGPARRTPLAEHLLTFKPTLTSSTPPEPPQNNPNSIAAAPPGDQEGQPRSTTTRQKQTGGRKRSADVQIVSRTMGGDAFEVVSEEINCSSLDLKLSSPPVYRPPTNCPTELPSRHFGETVNLANLYMRRVSPTSLGYCTSHRTLRALEFVKTPLQAHAHHIQIALGPDPQPLGVQVRNGVGYLGGGRTWSVYACDLWLPPLNVTSVLPAKTTGSQGSSSNQTDSGTSLEILVTPEKQRISPPVKAVVKICCPTLMNFELNNLRSGEYSCPEEVERAIDNEAFLYEAVYSSPECDTVPTYYGLYRGFLQQQSNFLDAEAYPNSSSRDVRKPSLMGDQAGTPIWAMVCRRSGEEEGSSWSQWPLFNRCVSHCSGLGHRN